MSRMLVLEDFEPDPAVPVPNAREMPEPTAAVSDESYERGYRAGWDDCERQAEAARRSIGAELARNVHELGFTYLEARAHVLAGMTPLLQSLLDKVLAPAISATLGPATLHELTTLAETAADAPVTILVAPDSHASIAEFLSGSTALPYRLVPEPTLGANQLFFRLGEQERLLDLDAVMAGISARLAAFTNQNERILKHG